MRSTLVALCWKEYRELLWSVLAMLGIALCLPLYALVRAPDTAYFWVLTMLVVYSIVGGIFFGMRAAAGERAARSASMLAAMPISATSLGAVKLGATSLAVLIPVASLALLGIVVRSVAETSLLGSTDLAKFTCVAGVTAAYMAIVIAAFGTGQRTELLAAGCGLLAVGIWGIAAYLAVSLSMQTHWQWLVGVFLAGPPILWLSVSGDVPWSKLVWLGIPACAMAAMSAAFVLRYDHALASLVTRREWAVRGWSPSGARSPLAWLVWKQICEVLPLVLLVLGIALVLACVNGVGFYFQEQTRYRNPPASVVEQVRDSTAFAARFFGVLACMGGFLLALLLGIVAFAGDLEPRVNTFWRSRPISPTVWFWSKYTISFLSQVIAVGVPALTALLVALALDYEWALAADGTSPLVWVGMGWFGMFSASVLSTCLVRRPLYAGILAVGMAAAAIAVAQRLDASWFGGEPLKHPLLIAAVWLLASVAATLVAWWAAVRDVAVFE